VRCAAPKHPDSARAEVMKLLAEGHTSKKAAAILGLSTKTVEAHKFNLMRKLDIHIKLNWSQSPSSRRSFPCRSRCESSRRSDRANCSNQRSQVGNFQIRLCSRLVRTARTRQSPDAPTSGSPNRRDSSAAPAPHRDRRLPTCRSDRCNRQPVLRHLKIVDRRLIASRLFR